MINELPKKSGTLTIFKKSYCFNHLNMDPVSHKTRNTIPLSGFTGLTYVGALYAAKGHMYYKYSFYLLGTAEKN